MLEEELGYNRQRPASSDPALPVMPPSPKVSQPSKSTPLAAHPSMQINEFVGVISYSNFDNNLCNVSRTLISLS